MRLPTHHPTPYFKFLLCCLSTTTDPVSTLTSILQIFILSHYLLNYFSRCIFGVSTFFSSFYKMGALSSCLGSSFYIRILKLSLYRTMLFFFRTRICLSGSWIWLVLFASKVPRFIFFFCTIADSCFDYSWIFCKASTSRSCLATYPLTSWAVLCSIYQLWLFCWIRPKAVSLRDY